MAMRPPFAAQQREANCVFQVVGGYKTRCFREESVGVAAVTSLK